MKSPFIKDIVTDAEVAGFFLTSSAQVRKTKKDKDYVCLKLCDKTGEVDARLWDIPEGFEPKDGVIVKVKGQSSTYNDQLQVSIAQIRVAEVDEYALEDFFRRSEREPFDMMTDLRRLLSDRLAPWSLVGDAPPDDLPKTPVYQLLDDVLLANKELLYLAPAAKSVHHCYLGGLLEHVLSMCRAAVPLCEHYGLREELVLAGCVLHDVGKIRELEFNRGTSYSTEGTLLGHIVIGLQMISEAMSKVDFPPKLKMEILHLVASHHGQLSFGSPKIPLMREAIALHLIDMLDSRMGICAEAMRGNYAADQAFTNWVSALEGPLYRNV